MSAILDQDPSTDSSVFDPFGGGSIERVIATTQGQREVWLAHKLGSAASLAFNESVNLRLRGPLDLEALNHAMQALVQLHPSLRSTISPDGTEMLVEAAVGGPIKVEDLHALSPEHRAAALTQAAIEAVESAFDLERGPLFRACLYRLADDDHSLMLTAHHVICDGWSWGVIAEDLGTLYAEQLGAGPSPEPAAEFSDYAGWESAEANGSTGVEHERFWLQRFSGGSLPVLDLPTDRPRPRVRSFESRRIDHALKPALVAELRKTGAKLGSSLFATLYAGFAATLYRLTGQTDLVIGVPAAGQSASGLHRLVGHCVNLLPVRTQIDPQAPFQTFAQQARTELLDAFDHQATTYGALLTKLKIERDPSRLPLVSVMFNVDPAVRSNADAYPGLRVELSSNPRHFENFELFLNVTALSDGSLQLECQYNTGLFDAASVARWLRIYEALLQAAVADVRHPVGRMSALSQQELADIQALQPQIAPMPEAVLMHHAFERQAVATPDRIAVECDGQSVTYRTLDELANRLAHALRVRGVQRGSRVGICLPRGSDMLVALLGVLKAGATYVPLDPGFPPARLAYYAEDARLALLLTSSEVAVAPTAWRADAADRVLRLDTDTEWRVQPTQALPAGAGDAQPGDAAYVIYTSGSTGKPKGVNLPHYAVHNFLSAMQVSPGIGQDDVLAAVTTLSFDIAVLELMLPLSVGAKVLIVSRETALESQALRALLEGRGATMMQATPGLWRLLLDTPWRGGPGFKSLVGGESLPVDLAQEMLARTGQVWNMYGPTETTVWSTTWRVDRSAMATGGVSIGKPIRNTAVWIVDEAGQLCAVGVPGEICIGGHGVALGYLDRPELTAERFVPDRFIGIPGAMMYRTGDRGRWRNDGLLEHLGRLDFQVKVRGYRIELGEIEASCTDWAGISESTVLAREDHPGDVRLVAYVTPTPGAALDEAALRTHWRQRLPEYMVPQHLMVLDALPRLPNGKVDRKALPAPQQGASAKAVERVPPRTETEKLVLAAMERVLKLPGLSVNDDFFAVGGHSLLAARLTSSLNRELGIALTLRTLFDSPTAEKLAVAVDHSRGLDAPVREAIAHDATARRAPLTTMQERIRFIEELHPGRVVYNTPSGHRLRGPMDVGAFQRAFQSVIDRQPALRTFLPRERGRDGYEQVVVDTLSYILPFEDLTELPADQREAEMMRRMTVIVDTPIDLHAAPLFRASLYKLSDEEHGFLFMPHHMVWDGWSFDLLYNEMSALYPACVAGRPDPLPPLAVTHLDHAQWFARWQRSEEHAAQLAYWKKRFASAPCAKAPQPDRPRGAGMSGIGSTEHLRIEPEFTEQLRSLARRADATLNMLTMAAYVLMFASVVDTPATVVAVPVRGRLMPEIEPVMGFFNNLLPLPLTVDRAQPVLDFVRSVKADLIEAFAHQEVPFETIASQPEVLPHSQAAGLYQALFSYQDSRDREQQWGGLRHTAIALFQKGATEDLGLWIRDMGHGLDGGFTFNADLYTPETAKAFREHYLEILQRLVAQPELSVGALAAMPESAAARHLRRLAGTPLQATTTTGRPPAIAPEEAPQSAAERAVAEVWASLLQLDGTQLSRNDRFFSIGGTSLAAMRTVGLLEERFGHRLPTALFVDNPSIREMADALVHHRMAQPLVTIRDGGPGKPLFLVHDGEGETLLYRNLALALEGDRPVLGLQPLAAKGIALVHSSRSEMAEHYLKLIREVQPTGPYHLGGLCAGGTLAYEVALRLQAQGQSIGLLLLMDANHPIAKRKAGLATQNRLARLKDALRKGDSMSFTEATLYRTRQVAGRGYRLARYEVGTKVTDLVTRFKAAKLRRHLAEVEELPEDLAGLTFTQLYASVRDDSDPHAVLNAGAVLVRATQGNGDQADAPFVEQYDDPSFGWRERIGGTLSILDVPGGHLTMLQEPYVSTLAVQLRSHIEQAAALESSAEMAPDRLSRSA